MKDRKKAIEQKKRLDQLVIHLKMNMVDLADLAGLNKNTLYHVGSGQDSEITERSVARICYHLEKKKGILLNREWLLNGTGEMFDNQHPVVPLEPGEEGGTEPVAADNDDHFGTNWRDKYYALLEKYTQLLEHKA
ncbi:MAG: hypothetical protein IKV77_05220 [Alistipes sp.]|nr:hypothetical protein [Bacteroidales bacterium]MBR5492512.1 hypothetical protein [Alistipes sp.]MBR5920035.1 hypothetical protein [Bacteroidales bacterium]